MKTLLFKPFERYSETALLSVGLLSAVLGIALATWFNARFDGVLDLHFTEGQSYVQTAMDMGVNLVSLLVFLYPVALWINRKTRFVDILSTVLIAKIPMYLLVFFNAGAVMFRLGNQLVEAVSRKENPSLDVMGMTLFILFIVVTLLFVVWSVALLYNGYKTAANARGTKAVILFIAALLFAEILSKFLLYWLGTTFIQA